ncbi:exosome nuclease subunit [Elasticomyces elasticus]|nr:exosome nuclease subunit [Elasticomyces elasticus]
MEPIPDFQAFQSRIQAALIATTRAASQITAEDLPYHRTLDPAFASALDRQNARLLGLTERLLSAAASNTEVVRPRLPDADAVESSWKGIVDVLDSLLEKADASLDEYTGAVKRLSPGREQTATPRPTRTSKIANMLGSQDLPKPQLLFQHVPTNAEKQLFKPLLQSKPHAIIPFEESLTQVPAKEDTQQYVAPKAYSPRPRSMSFSQRRVMIHEALKDYQRYDIDQRCRYRHPYQHEIEQYSFPSSTYEQAEPIPYKPFASTTATFVDTEEAVEEMLRELKNAKEIAIDLEHHDTRSYIGIVSLMQISTRDRDWIVDTLKPWRQKLECLNEVFADPRILKVLHGAHMDIIWLQRDLGLYIVGLFDTHHAARALGYTGGSLAFLLKKFIDFDAQKQYQTADWRIRPLPQEMFDYARSDTHFLLYVFDNMRNELIAASDFSIPNHERDKLHDVLVKSTETALQRYEHPLYDSVYGLGPAGWYRMLARTPALFDKEQFAVFRAIHEWRDKVAREQDDSVHYVMPNHSVLTLARQRPTDPTALFSATPITQTMRLRADELIDVITKARAGGADGPDMLDVLRDAEARYPLWTPAPAVVKPIAVAPVANAVAASMHTPVHGVQPSDAQALRSTTSSFWGKALPSRSGLQQRSLSTANIKLEVPLPPLTAAVLLDPREQVSEPMLAPPEPTKRHQEESSDDTFIMKQLGKGQKRKSDMISSTPADDSMAAQDDEVEIDSLDAQAPTKAARRAERRLAKRMKKQQQKQEPTTPGPTNRVVSSLDGQEEPFDYASAPSLLHPARENQKEERRRKRKEFNPYAKAMDAPKGLPRVQKERAGRSMTFRS